MKLYMTLHIINGYKERTAAGCVYRIVNKCFLKTQNDSERLAYPLPISLNIYPYTFGDYFILRRELIEAHLLDRLKDGSKYRKVEQTQE